MLLAKKLFFSLPFALAFLAFCLFIKPFLQDPNLLFSLDIQILLLYVWIVVAAISTAIFFSVFVALNQDIKIILCPFPAIILSTYLLLPNSPGLVFAIGSCVIFFFMYISLQHTLDTYITFAPDVLLTPAIGKTVTFLFLLVSFSFYLSSQESIQTHGFSLPQSLFDAVTQAIPQDQLPNLPSSQAITPEQISQLKQNPQLLQQFGLSPDTLDQFTKTGTGNTAQQLVQSQIKKQVSDIIKPYEGFIAPLFGVFFFFTLRFFATFLGFFVGPLLRLLFWALDRTKFTYYIIETRQVQKLVA